MANIPQRPGGSYSSFMIPLRGFSHRVACALGRQSYLLDTPRRIIPTSSVSYPTATFATRTRMFRLKPCRHNKRAAEAGRKKKAYSFREVINSAVDTKRKTCWYRISHSHCRSRHFSKMSASRFRVFHHSDASCGCAGLTSRAGLHPREVPIVDLLDKIIQTDAILSHVRIMHTLGGTDLQEHKRHLAAFEVSAHRDGL